MQLLIASVVLLALGAVDAGTRQDDKVIYQKRCAKILKKIKIRVSIPVATKRLLETH